MTESTTTGLTDTHCDACGRPSSANEFYRHRNKRLCEDCAMDARMPRTRKTHWQYSGSIKGDYLRPSPRRNGSRYPGA